VNNLLTCERVDDAGGVGDVFQEHDAHEARIQTWERVVEVGGVELVGVEEETLKIVNDAYTYKPTTLCFNRTTKCTTHHAYLTFNVQYVKHSIDTHRCPWATACDL